MISGNVSNVTVNISFAHCYISHFDVIKVTNIEFKV